MDKWNFPEHCNSFGITDSRYWDSSVKDLRTLAGVSHEAAEAGIHIDRSRYANFCIREQFTPEQWGDLEHEGLSLTKDFLSPEYHDRAREYITSQAGSLAKNGQTMLRDTTLLHAISHGVAKAMGIEVGNPRFANAMTNNSYLQTVHNKPQDGDIQKDLHQDTFCYAYKWWYYAHAVSTEHGPTRYVKGSHILGKRKKEFMQREYMRYYTGDQDNQYSIEGSLRISDEEAESKWGNITHVVVPENTLVVLNVFGFHSRSDVMKECKRKSLHGSIRFSNPFYRDPERGVYSEKTGMRINQK